jgi:signal transduction histidine kinase
LFRIDKSFSTIGTNKEKGTGLGLLLCKEIAEKHGSELKVQSELGQGSCFSFKLSLDKS